MEQDKRNSERILFDSSIRYFKKGATEYSDTLGKDISYSGIGFISNEFIPKKSHLMFEMHSPWRTEPIQTLAEVVWISKQPCSERFEIGARFLTSLPQI